jgi:hypothetical protein
VLHEVTDEGDYGPTLTKAYAVTFLFRDLSRVVRSMNPMTPGIRTEEKIGSERSSMCRDAVDNAGNEAQIYDNK